MNYGYVKVAAAIPCVKVADCKFNAGQIEKQIIMPKEKVFRLSLFRN